MKREEIYCNRGYRMSKDGTVTNPKGKVLKGVLHQQGYKVTTHLIDGKLIQIYFHRVQAFLKFGHKIYEDKMVVRHLNGDKTDNSFDNIGIGTDKDNAMDMSEEMRRNRAAYARTFIPRKYNHAAIITYYKNHSEKETMDYFNIPSGSFYRIVNGRKSRSKYQYGNGITEQ